VGLTSLPRTTLSQITRTTRVRGRRVITSFTPRLNAGTSILTFVDMAVPLVLRPHCTRAPRLSMGKHGIRGDEQGFLPTIWGHMWRFLGHWTKK